MIFKKERSQSGVTLLEIMLVLGIMSFIFIMAMRSYQSLADTFRLQQVNANVDQLFQAAQNYYRANCGAGGISPQPPNFLSPYPTTSGTQNYSNLNGIPNYSLSINNVLLSDGYLDNWHPANPFVDPSGGESGYIVQLNPLVMPGSIQANACVAIVQPGNLPSACFPITNANIAYPNAAYQGSSASSIPSTQAQVVSWSMQVSVKIRPLSKIGGYAAMLGADCVSSLDPTNPNTVQPCKANSPLNYATWQRTVSTAYVKKPSAFVAFIPLMQQFNLQYTHDQNFEFSSGVSTANAPVYYLCGG